MLTLRRTLYNNIIFILVGPEKVKFGVHQGVLVQRSPFFQAALTGKFKEAMEGRIILHDGDPDVFAVFVSWLYTTKLENMVDETSSCTKVRLIKLYLFADRYDVPILRNDVIDALYKNWKEDPRLPISYFQEVYDTTPPRDPLRRLFVDLITSDTKISESVLESHEYYPKEMLLDLVGALSNQLAPFRERAWNWEPNEVMICSIYHTHEDGSANCEET